MKYVLLIVIGMVLYYNSHAHNAHEAFFSMKQNKNTIEITAEFPWTLRNSLILFPPKLEVAKSKSEFETVFIEYVKKNLILIDKAGNKMPFLSFKELDNKGHTHGNNYLLVFKGTHLAKISNTIMFNISEEQVNYHTLEIEKNRQEFETNPKHPSMILKNDLKFSYWYLCLLIPFVFYYFYLSIQKGLL